MDCFAWYRDIADEFRADNGFVPQVGYRRGWGEVGRTWRPTTGFLRRLRSLLIVTADYERDGDLIFRRIMPAVGMDARWNSFLRFEGQLDEVRAGDRTFERNRLGYADRVEPRRACSTASGSTARSATQIDFANARGGSGPPSTASPDLARPTIWSFASTGAPVARRGDRRGPRRAPLYGARGPSADPVHLLLAPVRSPDRPVGRDREDPSLYTFDVEARSGDFSGSALLAYKLNWQSVVFVGYGDSRALDESENLEKAERQFFVKVSYAFQM